jgi:ATP-binding cassette subfamily C protein
MEFPWQHSGKRVRTPTVLQMEAVECGAAALAIILGYYGCHIPLPTLRMACGVSRDGSKASNILKVARQYGMKADGYREPLDTLFEEHEFPFIVFWNFNHFLVVEGMKRNTVYLSDPALGRRSVSFEAFDKSFTGVVLDIRPGPEFQKQDLRQPFLKALWQRLKSSTGALGAAMFLGLLLLVPQLVLPVFSGQFVDQVLLQDRVHWARPIISGILITVILQVVLSTLQLRFLRQLRVKLGIEQSSQFLWHVLLLPQRFYLQRFAGEISSRVGLTTQVADTLSGQLAVTIISLVTLVFYGLIMASYHLPLTLVVVVFAAINLLTLQWIAQRRIDLNKRLMQDLGKASGIAISGLQSIETLKASGLESDFFNRWAGYYARTINSRQQLAVYTQQLETLPPVINNLANLAVIVLGGLAVINGQLTIGGLVAFQMLTIGFLMPVNTLVDLGQQLQDLVANIDRLDDVLENSLDPEVSTTVTLADAPDSPVPLEGYVDLVDISFGYSLVAKPLIEGFHLSIKPAQQVALVGATGSGKSTIAKIIAGLYQPLTGEVKFDGRRRSDIPRVVLVNSLAMVSQDIVMFEGTIRDNLTLWNPSITNHDLVQACKDAEIHETVVALPGSYDALLAEGASNLSGGQRQRLEIARALVLNPSILIMDEATSALDPETEWKIMQNLRKRSCSCILVAHRLSTIRDADEIIVLQQGNVLERGTHEQLWEQAGYYYGLLNADNTPTE